ncbi:MAG: tetratricopeptide repeat protein [Flavobacteriales bacterium]
MKHSLVAILLFLSQLAGATGTPDHYRELFDQANMAYKAGRYDSAKTLYAEIAQNGLQSPELFYNLGNTYYKDGNLPAAILYFERALKLNPADQDIRYNLDVANTLIPDKIDAIEPLFVDTWFSSLANSMSVNSWAWLFILILTLGCAALAMFFTSRNSWYRQVAFISGIALIAISAALLSVGFKAKSLSEKQAGIVFSPSVNVKSEPSMNSTVQFIIHEGLKVEIVAEDGDWSRIALSDGNSGWIPNQSIERI